MYSACFEHRKSAVMLGSSVFSRLKNFCKVIEIQKSGKVREICHVHLVVTLMKDTHKNFNVDFVYMVRKTMIEDDF